MAEPDLKRVKEVYTGALELPLQQRLAYIEQACQGDPQLKDKVERMLAAMEGAADFMTGEGQIAGADTQSVSATTQSHPESIGHYKILHTIGEGGMGIVYLAEQTEPVRRRVALKLVKLGMDTKQVIARFEAERQALAMMDHPNVAQVFEAGATETGRPYFAMEYVPGVPITKFCDTLCLTVPERLELFMQVCGAIQHAHQKGIIHRDLKPSNVLVMRQDGKPVPKVIDFGVAKATQQRLTEQTLFTEQGQMIGTPAYMSPEQAEMSPLGVDSRTDVYSLGVLLYELLVSMLPFEPAELRRAGYAEIQRIIREVDPPKPSTRFNSLADESGSICDQRRLDSKAMRRLLEGDLDWITMRAMDKDPGRRYASASELAADVGRYLKDEPVVASPPGGAYRLRKFVRRNRTGVIAAAVVLVVLLGGIAGTSVGLIRARTAELQQNRARQEADNARQQAEQARDAEAEQRQIAEQKTIEAQDNLELARTQEQEANASRDEAQKQKQQAENAAHEARRQSYLASIRGAQASIQANDVRSAGDLLDQAPDEFRRWEWKYLHAQLDQSLAVLRGHENGPWSVAFSPDGSRIASGGGSTVRLWDAASGEELAVLRGHEKGVLSVAFSPDGSRIASGSKDKTVRLWDAASGEELVVLRGGENGVSSVAFSPDGSRIASGGADTVRLWDVSSGEQLRVLRGHKGSVYSVAFSPDGSRIVSGLSDETVRLWDAASGEELVVFRGHEDIVWSVAFSPDGASIASGSRDKTMRLWDASSGDELAVLRGHESAVNKVAFSQDGKRIVSASGDNTVRIWDAVSGDELAVLRGHESAVNHVAFSQDGKRIVSSSSDNTVRLWDASIPDDFTVLRGPENGVESVAFSPDGSRIALGSGNLPRSRVKDYAVRLWDATSGEQLLVLSGHERQVRSVVFSPDGSRIASGSNDKTVRLWDASSGEQLRVLRGHEYAVASVSFSPDGSRIVSGSRDKTVRLWDAESGRELRVLRGHENDVTSAAFSPDGSRIASGSYDHTVRLWDASTGDELLVLGGHEGSVNSIAFSPDGSRIATGSDDKTVRLWNAASGEELLVLRGHQKLVYALAFSPDGTRLASGSRDATVRLWDASTGDVLLVLRDHKDSVYSVAFSPDGSRIASSGDETVRLWDTIAYRHRVTERDDARRAEQTMSRFVDELFNKGLDCSVVADQMRADASLSEPLRHAAINLVLKRCSAIRKQAHSLIEDVEKHFVYTADIQAAVQENTSLEPAAHAATINIARLIEDTPGRLSRRARRIVDDDERSADDYERAQRAAASAFQSDSTSLDFARTLAKAWTRLHQPDKAIAVWREHVDKLRKDIPADDSRLAETLIEYGKALLENDQAKDAEPMLRECLSIREKALVNRELWFRNTEETRRVLGECLTHQGADPSLALGARIEKLREAETILIELANETLDNDAASEESKAEALERVVKLYEAWYEAEPDADYDAKATEWRAKLGEEAEIKGNKAARQQGNEVVRYQVTEGEEPTSQSATTRPSLPAASQPSTR